MKNLLIAFMLIAVSGIAAGQTNSFLIYSAKGAVSVIENKTETAAKVGKILGTTATIKLAKGAIVTLICNEASMFTLGKSGNYPLKNFGDSCRVNNSSVSSRYIKYVWAQMTSHGEGTPGSNRKAFMNNVGAVSRGGPNNIWIDQRLDTINFSGTTSDFPLSWKSFAEAKDFEFSLFSKEDIAIPVYTSVVSKLKISISAFMGKIKTGNSYYWTAAVKGEENDELKIFNYVSKETSDALMKNLKSQGAAYETPAEQAYRLGFMLEDKHYLAEAYQNYSNAVKLDSANNLYRSTLMSFKKDYEIK
jgi:hypothetical protein